MSQVIAPNLPAPTPSSVTFPATTQTMHLNSFQQLMRLWNHLGPYSAGQIMTVSGASQASIWQQAICAVISETGLGIPTVDEKQEVVCFKQAAEIPLPQITQPWQEYVRQQLNIPFENNALPFRFFLIPGESQHTLGVIYDHWIADSRAMRELMSRIFARYRAQVSPSLVNPVLAPLTAVNPPFAQVYGQYFGPFSRLISFKQSVWNYIKHRKAYRVNLADPLNFHSDLLYRQLPTGLVHQVHAWAKKHQASVNDAFLAVLGQTMGNYTAADRYRKRHSKLRTPRTKISLGTIVDIRTQATESLDNVFGLYLSSYPVLLANPEQNPIASVLESVARQTKAIKANHGTIKTFAALDTARRWWKLSDKPKWRALFFQKNIPITAGISNVNMTSSPPIKYQESLHQGPLVLDYIRISPTGPLLPLVFTLTTINDQLSLCVTYRTTAFSAQQVEGIINEFIDHLSKATVS